MKNICFTIFVFLIHLSFSAGATEYRIVDIGLSQYEVSEITGINQKGQICGIIKSQNTIKVFVWDPVKKLKSYMAPINTKVFINHSGQVAGSYWVKETGSPFNTQRVFLWENPYSFFNSFKDLGTPENLQKNGSVEKRAVVWDLNDKGQILVMNTSSSSNNEAMMRQNLTQLWIWEKGNFQQIMNPDLSYGVKLSNDSKILGHHFEGKFPFSRSILALLDLKTMTVQKLPFPASAYGSFINDKGEIVGIAYQMQKKLFDGFYYRDEQKIDLENFFPAACNNRGEIIGHYQDADQKMIPMLWKDGLITDLTTIIDMKADNGLIWDSIDRIVGINDLGQIVGNGKLNGKQHGFLLVPLE